MTAVSPEFVLRLALILEPDASDDWLDGFQAAISARTDATEADLVEEAVALAAEASGWERAMLALDDADDATDDLLNPAFPVHQ